MGFLRSVLKTAAIIATGGLALSILPDEWTGIDGCDDGGDE
jgi:hypothetical protein